MAVSAKPIESRDAERCCEIAVRATTAVAFLKVKTNLPTDLAGMLEQFDRSLQARKHRPIDLGGDLQFHVNVIRLQSQHVFFKGLQLLGLLEDLLTPQRFWLSALRDRGFCASALS